MNHLLNHPVLKDLPYEILNDPSLESIKHWLVKKKKTVKIFKSISAVLFFMYLAVFLFSGDVNYSNEGLDKLNNINEIVMLFVFLVIYILLHYQGKKLSMTDEEILEALESVEKKNTN
ncbi:hypothetical protein [Caldithrix abyssi]